MVPQAVDTDNVITKKEQIGESITELVRRHLTNEFHTTTDEELKNVRLNIYSTDDVKGVY